MVAGASGEGRLDGAAASINWCSSGASIKSSSDGSTVPFVGSVFAAVVAVASVAVFCTDSSTDVPAVSDWFV